MSRIALISLGRYGDCCNALPIALHEFSQGNHVTFYISKEFASLLDGVTYVEPYVWSGPYHECLKAAEHAEQSGKFDKVLVCQVYGSSIDRQTDSFCKEAWRAVGYLHLWGKLRLWFDNRSRERESVWVNAAREGGSTKPILLVNYAGRSSAFPALNAHSFLQLLMPLKDQFVFFDISGGKCERFYDLIGLYEIASCLITIDSGPLHLANAVPKLPVIALITDRPDNWHGSPTQPNHLLRIRYGEFDKRKGEILTALNQIAAGNKVERRIIHAWNDYPYRSQDAGYRHGIAKESWEQQYKKGRWIPCPVPDAQLPRNAQSIGETKPLPFVNDIINIAAEQAQPDDLIVVTNDDTIFVDDLTERLLNTQPPFWGSRWEHGKVKGPLDATSIKHKAWKHVGADIFVFTKRWWMEFGSELPDFIVAREQWDLILRACINLHGGREEDALVAHIIHDPEWHSAQYRESVGNLFNRESAQKFVRANKLKWPII